MLALFVIAALAVIPWALLWMLTCVRDKQPAFVPYRLPEPFAVRTVLFDC